MSTVKITEKEVAELLENEASILITQDVDGVESLRRVSISTLIDALKENGILDDIDPGLAFDEISFDESGYFHIMLEGVDVVDPCFIGTGGGGGGSDSGSSITIVNRNTSRNLTVYDTSTQCNILYSATSVDSSTSESTGNIYLSWYVNGTRVKTLENVVQGNGTFDCKPYLTRGSTDIIKLVVEDSYGGTKSMQWSVNSVTLSLTWNVEDFANHGSESLNMLVTPSGSGSKTVKVSLDGTLIYNQTTEASGRAIAISVPAQEHGAHVIMAWIETTIDGTTISTTPLRHIGIWVDDDDTTPIVAWYKSSESVAQFGTVTLKYRVFNPSSETSTITLVAAGASTSLTVDRSTQTYAYRPLTTGTKQISITCGSVNAVCSVAVSGSDYDIQAVTRGLVMDLDPTGHNNEEVNRTSFGYKDGSSVNHPLTFSSNFDWTSGGFQRDSEGITAFVVKRGTYVDFDRSLFNDEAKTSGKEIKIVFKATECRDYDAQFMTCYANNIGLRLQAQQATLTSALETATVQYCEEAKIEMDINIEASTENQLAVIWLKGIPSAGVAYGNADTWQQSNPAILRIGSDDCDVWIYRMKMYSTSLTRFEILDNFIADCSDTTEMIDRYERNDIFNANGTINQAKLSAARPELRVIQITAEKMTVSKSDEVPCSVTLKYGNGGTDYEFTATGVTMKAQGTSSLEYILAALNLDLDFKNATSWVDGNGEDITGYSMTENSIPVNYINIKLNVASSESANNAMGADDYNAFQPYIVAQRAQNPKVRDTCEGHPCVVFFTNSKSEAIEVGARTVEAGETILYGCGDIINSKKNYDVFGQDTSVYPYQCCIEINNNNNPQTRFKSDDFSSETWDGEDTSNFEFRYPKNPTAENKNDWVEAVTWLVSTDRDAATDEALPDPVVYDGVTYTLDTEEYRAAKFKAELADYFAVDSLLYHYLFTERQCMVDNRAKNTFFSFEVADYADRNDKTKYRWNICKNYDDDTMQGNDNSGGLTFTYGLEDTDTVAGQKVFNASDSVLWVNIRDLMQAELKAMFVNREAAGAWSATRILAKWKLHQSARPESLVVEDMWGKYFMPYINKSETKYIDMMLGTKEYQRQQFQTYQEKYMSSKYGGSVSTADRIVFRPQISEADSSGDITGIVPYADVYITVKYGEAYTSRQRAKRGQTYSVSVPDGTTISDLETYIYSASMIKEFDSLSRLYTKKAEMQAAAKLQQVLLGSDDDGYTNVSLTSLSLGNNILLEKIDLQGTPNLAQALDLSALKSLKEIYTVGSGITGLTFAKNCPLETAQLSALRQLTIKDVSSLETFSMPTTNLQTLCIENTPAIDELAMVQSAASLTRGRLVGIDWTLNQATVLLRLAELGGIDSEGRNTSTFVLIGDCYVDVISQDEVDTIEAAFPQLNLTYRQLLPSYTVTFKNYDGTVLNTQSVRQFNDAVDPVTSGLIPTPTKPSTTEKNFAFQAWSGTFSYVTQDLIITATFSETTRQYTVRWLNGVQVLQTGLVDAHGSATYTGAMPTLTENDIFIGWDDTPSDVVEDMDISATFDTVTMPQTKETGHTYLYSDDTNDDSAYTLGELVGIINSGRANEWFEIGDQIKIVPAANSVYTDTSFVCSVHGYNHFRLTDDTDSFAKVVFGMVGLMSSARVMNSTNTNAGGYPASSMRTFLETRLFPTLPLWWQSLIKQVEVLSSKGGQSPDIVSCNDHIFLFSTAEVGFRTSETPYKDEVATGAERKSFACYSSNTSRIKKTFNGTGSANYWWVRSPDSGYSTNFRRVFSNGNDDTGTASNANGVCWGFCI